MEEKRKKVFGETFERNCRLRTIILDTDILIDHVHGFAIWLDEFLKEKRNYLLVVPTIVIAEYNTAQELETFDEAQKSNKYLSTFSIQDLNREIAELLGTLLRKKSYPLGADLGDLIVASTALFLNAELATRNKKHFTGIPRLRFFNSKL